MSKVGYTTDLMDLEDDEEDDGGHKKDCDRRQPEQARKKETHAGL